MKPVYITRLISWLFLIFFLTVGALASYYLSRRLYRPIREIREGLKPHHLSGEALRHEGDEFDVIKRYSQFIMTENKELFQMVSGIADCAGAVLRKYYWASIVTHYRLNTTPRRLSLPTAMKRPEPSCASPSTMIRPCTMGHRSRPRRFCSQS